MLLAAVPIDLQGFRREHSVSAAPLRRRTDNISGQMEGQRTGCVMRYTCYTASIGCLCPRVHRLQVQHDERKRSDHIDVVSAFVDVVAQATSYPLCWRCCPTSSGFPYP